MNKPYVLITAILIAIPSAHVFATEMNSKDATPPAQMERNTAPDSTKNGDYLEPQPDENGALSNTKDKHSQKKHKDKSKNAKPSNIEKSKKVTEDPDNGGMDVKSY